MTRRDDDASDADVARALIRAGRRAQPTDAQLQRWQQQLAGDLAQADRRRRRTRLLAFVGTAAAAVLVLALLRPDAAPAPEQGPELARVATALGGVVVREIDGDAVPLEVGDAVRAGERVEVGQRSALGLMFEGLDVRIARDTAIEFFADGIDLRRGRLYVDTRNGGGDLRVRTPLGEFEHTGTQYLVGVRADEVLAAVREGSIVLHGHTGDVALEAPAGAARSLVVSADGAVSTRPVKAWGELWQWTESVSAGLSLAGVSADTGLRWVARERGQRLVYATPAAEAASRAVLGGSARPVQASQALDIIEAATGLQVRSDTRPGTMTVQLDSEADQHTD